MPEIDFADPDGSSTHGFKWQFTADVARYLPATTLVDRVIVINVASLEPLFTFERSDAEIDGRHKEVYLHQMNVIG